MTMLDPSEKRNPFEKRASPALRVHQMRYWPLQAPLETPRTKTA